MKAEIMENTAVQAVVSDIDMAREAAQNAQKLALIAFGMAFLFVIIAITLIHNTIRLALYADRFLIKNMELVGASWDFIARPYLLRGIKNGFWSAFWAILGVCILLWSLQPYLSEIKDLLFSPLFFLFLLLLIFLGVFISWISTYFVVNKYLKMKLDDLY
jgi:cell division transport system permease protein